MRRAGWLSLACLLAGCIELPDFPEANVVAYPRVLAVIADPPEARPGQSVQLSLLLSHPLDVSEAEWRVCGEYFSFSGGNQYGDGESGEGCSASDPVFARGPSALLPGFLSSTLFANLDLAREVLGSALPEGTIELVRTRVGLPVLVEVRFEHDGRMVRATKRVLVSERAVSNSNPPPPVFALGDRQVSVPDPERPFECTTGEAVPPTVAPGVEVELAPALAGLPEEPWLEPYQVIDARGSLQNRKETAFYSWYTTGGDLSPGVSKSPDRDATWQTPSDLGCHRLWVIVRDGHGGSSACSLPVRVGRASGAGCE